MVLSDDKSYCLVSSHIQHGLNYHSDKLGPWSDLASPDCWGAKPRGQHLYYDVFKSYFVQDSKDLREAIYHISELS